MIFAGPIDTAQAYHDLPRPLIVSLTSHRARFRTLSHALRSVRPDRVVLWLPRGDLPELPWEVKNLPGLEVRGTDDIGPYTKVVPAVREFEDSFIVVADDDKHYVSGWLYDLVSAYAPTERALLCHRAHRIVYNDNGMPLPYNSWIYEISEPETSNHIFPTGCGGIMFPPGLIPTEAWDEKLFLRLSPKNDDIFIYALARKYGCAIKKVSSLYRFPDVEATQGVALAHHNLSGANDLQLNETLSHFSLVPLQKINEGVIGA